MAFSLLYTAFTRVFLVLDYSCACSSTSCRLVDFLPQKHRCLRMTSSKEPGKQHVDFNDIIPTRRHHHHPKGESNKERTTTTTTQRNNSHKKSSPQTTTRSQGPNPKSNNGSQTIHSLSWYVRRSTRTPTAWPLLTYSYQSSLPAGNDWKSMAINLASLVFFLVPFVLYFSETDIQRQVYGGVVALCFLVAYILPPLGWRRPHPYSDDPSNRPTYAKKQT
mmetsp:Transcript_22877/g.52970  ORF Transcript_22877/g.52970 Transcript_22877/m.52970 type:complete len:220 (-) Transcript_22877:1353-2012(-)